MVIAKQGWFAGIGVAVAFALSFCLSQTAVARDVHPGLQPPSSIGSKADSRRLELAQVSAELSEGSDKWCSPIEDIDSTLLILDEIDRFARRRAKPLEELLDGAALRRYRGFIGRHACRPACVSGGTGLDKGPLSGGLSGPSLFL